MKIIRGNKVYVQKKDIANLMNVVTGLSIPVPNGLIQQIFGDVFICSGNDANDFMKFEGEEAVLFFSGLDYIVDYDELNKLTEEELISYGNQINEERNNLVDTFNSKEEKERKLLYDKTSAEIASMELKMNGVAEFIFYKRKKLKFDLPVNSKSENFPIKKESKIKKLVRSIFENYKSMK